MSTTVTVAVAKPNHRPVHVFAEEKRGSQWVTVESWPSPQVAVGGAETFMIHGTRRLVIEEIPE